MKSALLGYTGFVGSTLARQTSFDDFYNTKNIASINGKKYDLVVCAAAPGVKWLANQNPEADWTSISTLMSHLKTVEANRFILISTVDVYPKPINVDEKTVIDPESNSAYGKHRFLLEKFVSTTFPIHTIIRLPGIFGEGIKKNIIYDLIHDNLVEKINPKSQFQFYNLDHLWKDIQKTLEAGIQLLNVTTEPVKASEIYTATFGKPLLNIVKTLPATYDVHSIYAKSANDHYISDKTTVLQEIKQFILTQRQKL